MYTWDLTGKKTETVVYTQGEYAAKALGSVGKYNHSDNFLLSALMQFGFPKATEYIDSWVKFPTYLNHSSSEKICLIQSKQLGNDWSNLVVQCSITDYTNTASV